MNDRLDTVTFQKLTNFFGKIGVTKPSSVPDVVVKFNKDSVHTYWEEKKNFILCNNNTPSVIGPINQRHQWLVLVDEHIKLFDVKRLLYILDLGSVGKDLCYYRANQKVLYGRLVASFKLPASPLPTPISIDEQ